MAFNSKLALHSYNPFTTKMFTSSSGSYDVASTDSASLNNSGILIPFSRQRPWWISVAVSACAAECLVNVLLPCLVGQNTIEVPSIFPLCSWIFFLNTFGCYLEGRANRAADEYQQRSLQASSSSDSSAAGGG